MRRSAAEICTSASRKVQPVQIDRLVAPRLIETRRRRGIGRSRAARDGEIETLEIQFNLNDRLVGKIDRTPAVELALPDRAGERIDRQQRCRSALTSALPRASVLQQARGLDREFEPGDACRSCRRSGACL